MRPIASQFLIAIPLPEPYATQVKEFRGANDRWDKPGMEPHITVVRPQSFHWLPDEIHEVQKLRLPETEVNFEGVSTFKNPHANVVYVPCESRGLAHAQQQVVSIFPKLASLVGEKPIHHITLASKVPDVSVFDVEEAAEAANIRGTFVFEALNVYVRYNSGPWQLLTA